MPNLNDAQEQREFGVPLPDGTFVWLRSKIRSGGFTMPNENPEDNGLFTHSKSSDAVMLDFEFTVVGGPYAGRNIWQNMVVDGGSRNEQSQSIAGNISKSTFRAMMESAYGVASDDKSPNAQAVRSPPAYAYLGRIEFGARLGLQEGELRNDGSGQRYPERNFIAHVVVPPEPEYAMLRAGQNPEPKPMGVRQARDRGRDSGGTTAAPAQSALWGPGAGQPAAAPAYQPQAAPVAPAAPPPPAAAAAAPPPPAQTWPPPGTAQPPAAASPAQTVAPPAVAPPPGAPATGPAPGPSWMR